MSDKSLKETFSKESDFVPGMPERIKSLQDDRDLMLVSHKWIIMSGRHDYGYNFSFLGRPIIQLPQDMIAIQELIWQTKPDLIIETGIAHGGSLIMNASMLAILDYCDAIESGTVIDTKATLRRVVGIDIDIRKDNRLAIESHPMSHRIDMIQGSSIDPKIINLVYKIAEKHTKAMILLDSNHTHEHVLAELEAYAPLTGTDSYCVVFDTIIEDLPDELCLKRLWGKNNNPKTAVWEYMRRIDEEGRKAFDGKQLKFKFDKSIEGKLLITSAPDGYLKRVT